MRTGHGVVVSKANVKKVKTLLEEFDLINKDIKIHASKDDPEGSLIIPTTVPCDEPFPSVLKDARCVPVATELLSRQQDAGNDLHKAFVRSVEKLPAPFVSRNVELVKHISELKTPAYCIYPPMLLLNSALCSDETFMAFIHALSEDRTAQEAFFTCLNASLKVDRVAMNAPIPSLTSVGDDKLQSTGDNVLRSPTHLRPLYGDFGPCLAPHPQHRPSTKDFDEALWVATKQNGIVQTWAPRYTMFSAGNVTEKARVLAMPSVQVAVAQGRESGRGCAAVDLFAGIGYFAFSYVKAGVETVLCWDLNPWSVEGLRRGAAANKWQCSIVDERHKLETTSGALGVSRTCQSEENARLLVFNESNVHAVRRIKQLGGSLGAIRHVNCGMLPSADAAWRTAVQILDGELGGWLHLHETVHEETMEDRTRSILAAIKECSDELGGHCKIELEHVEKVKNVGPRLKHIVLDIRVSPFTD